ncbi:group III truncated hemoglobin [Mangrovimonas futianensis]|uniref:group III truncated hemoglobin n=1 Tax=Mangrovimonas futianensis TaxID=2895523 RepID=UPI001E2B877A|nr:group III truncated hemoglobin [Mangrovimonas futianensis]MCF1422764.1 group III truncated hemoglobin [Mangrovimonas futianensis]
MEKTDIKNREDIHNLVVQFYGKIRKHEVLGPFFNNIITDWEAHFERLTQFWEANLFLKSKFLGNPLKVHVEVDRHFNHSITQEHFGLWLNEWVNTVDELFQGDYAENAKSKARKMSTFLFLNIYAERNNNS